MGFSWGEYERKEMKNEVWREFQARRSMPTGLIQNDDEILMRMVKRNFPKQSRPRIAVDGRQN